MLCDASLHGARVQGQDSGPALNGCPKHFFDSDLTFLVTFTKIIAMQALSSLWPAHLALWRAILIISWAPGGSHSRTVSP